MSCRRVVERDRLDVREWGSRLERQLPGSPCQSGRLGLSRSRWSRQPAGGRMPTFRDPHANSPANHDPPPRARRSSAITIPARPATAILRPADRRPATTRLRDTPRHNSVTFQDHELRDSLHGMRPHPVLCYFLQVLCSAGLARQTGSLIGSLRTRHDRAVCIAVPCLPETEVAAVRHQATPTDHVRACWGTQADPAGLPPGQRASRAGEQCHQRPGCLPERP